MSHNSSDSRTMDKIKRRNPGGNQSGMSGKSAFTGEQNSEFFPGESIDRQYFSLILCNSSIGIRSVKSSRFISILQWTCWNKNIVKIRFMVLLKRTVDFENQNFRQISFILFNQMDKFPSQKIWMADSLTVLIFYMRIIQRYTQFIIHSYKVRNFPQLFYNSLYSITYTFNFQAALKYFQISLSACLRHWRYQ